ncbi:MAG: hypothetical protein PUB89_14820 [Oscillospiraceae bacterium]|nr:hypothetical protein [Oscillospiraceae bacterium]MDD6084083.1 hypothetical protein [Oscillospiraceae bacterium]
MDEVRTSSVMQEMAYRYNQLYLTPEKGVSGTGVYSDIVRYGKLPPEIDEKIKNEGLSGFKCSEKDRLFSENTPAGMVDILFLQERSDFERFVQVMVYSCEPAAVASKIESAEILGVTNWRKIENHMNDYLSNGGSNLSWRDELRKFTNNKKNYQDTILVIGSGGYCGLTAEEAGFEKDTWEEISVKIKIYSSCARYIVRKLFSDYKDIIWEEMLADCAGLLYATGRYDVSLAKKFFGVSGKGYDRRGKLINFKGDSEFEINELAVRVSSATDKLGNYVNRMLAEDNTDYYRILFRLMEEMNTFVSIIKG